MDFLNVTDIKLKWTILWEVWKQLLTGEKYARRIKKAGL